MDLPEIRCAVPADRTVLGATLTLAFSADPFNRWYLADADSYLSYFPRVVDAFIGPSIDAGTCYMTAEGEAVALWFPPGVGADESLVEAVFAEAVPADLDETFGKLLQAFDHHHPHDDDCWYLPLIGVDPAHQGRGLGGALMKHVNTILDDQGEQLQPPPAFFAIANPIGDHH